MLPHIILKEFPRSRQSCSISYQSLGSQFLISHSCSDDKNQDSVAESTNKLRNGNLTPQTEQSISTGEAMVEDMVIKADHGITGT